MTTRSATVEDLGRLGDVRKPSFDGYLLVEHRFAERFFAADFAPTRPTAGDPLCDPAELPYERTAAGVAIVEIMGPLLQYGGYWWDGHEAIKSRCLTALADSQVRLLLLRIDSLGGVAAGCFDAVRAVRAAALAAGKDIIVWCGGDGAYSAGFAWACAGSEIALPDTGGVGSVGVLSTLYDRTAATAALGYRIVVVRSGQRKAEGHPDVPLTDGAIAREQAVVDGIAGIFAAEIVGPARELTATDVLAYEGECFYGQKAVVKGLADQVMPWDEYLSRAEARAKEITMQKIMGRLGLAASASEDEGVAAIEKIEQANAKTEADLTKVVDRCAAVLCDNAMRDRKITAAQRAGLIASVGEHRNGPVAGLERLDADLVSREAIAVPTPLREDGKPPQREGTGASKWAGKTYAELSENHRSELANEDRALFDKLRAESKAK